MKHRIFSATYKAIFILALLASAGFMAKTAFAAGPVVDNSGVCNDGTGIPVYCTIQAAINAANPNDTVTVKNGTYPELLDIATAGLTLAGESLTGVIIDAGSFSDYSIEVTADNVTLQDFTLLGNPAGTYGIKVAGPSPTRLQNITVQNVKVQNSKRTGIDLNGIDGALIKNVEVSGVPSGNGLSITDSNDVVFENITTSGNAWGGLAIYTYGRYFSLGSDNITVQGTNSFGEVNKVYVERGNFNNPLAPEPVTNLTVNGFAYTVMNDTFRSGGENFTFYQITQSDAINFAIGLATPGDSYVNEIANGHFWVGQNIIDTMTVQAAIDHASGGDTINVLPGTYEENINVDEYVKIIGAGSGADDTGNTILKKAGNVAVVTLVASGVSNATPILFKDFRVEPVGVYGFNVPSGSVEYIEFDNVHVVGSNPTNDTEAEVGLKVATAASLSNLVIDNSAFDKLHYGWYFAKHGDWGPGGSNVANVTVSNTSFSSNDVKGIYVEKLSDTTFDNVTVDNNGLNTTFWNATWNAGFDINLKGEENYQNITIKNSSFTGNSLGVKEGAAMMIKARDDGGTYGAHPASLDGVLVEKNTITGNERGVRLGEPGKNNATPTNVVVRNNNISGNVQTYAGVDGSDYGGVINQAQPLVAASLNWWGDAGGPSGVGPGSGDAVSANVAYCPWLDAAYPGGLPSSGGGLVTNTDTGELFCSIQAAVQDSDTLDGHTLEVSAGTFVEEGQIIIDKNLTITGDSPATTIVKTNQDTGTDGDSRGWWLVESGKMLDLSHLTLDGSGYKIWQAIRHKGSGSVDNVDFTNIKFNESGPSYAGTAIAAFGNGPVDVTNSTFTEIGRVGVLYFGSGVSGSKFMGNSYAGKGVGDWLDYALDIGNGAKIIVEDNTISGNRGVASSDDSISAGILVTTHSGPGTEATITNNNLSDSTTGIHVGYDGSDTSSVVAKYNNITGNDNGVTSTAPTVEATFNWWGDASGPGGAGPGTGDSVDPEVIFCPWLDGPFDGGGNPASFNGGFATTSTDGHTTPYCTIEAAMFASSGANQEVHVTEGDWPGEVMSRDYSDSPNLLVKAIGDVANTVVNGMYLTGSSFDGLTFDNFTITGDAPTPSGYDPGYAVEITGDGNYANLAFTNNIFDGENIEDAAAIFSNRGWDGFLLDKNRFINFNDSPLTPIDDVYFANYSLVFMEAQVYTPVGRGNNYVATNNSFEGITHLNALEAFRWQNVTMTGNKVTGTFGRLLVWSYNTDPLLSVNIADNEIDISAGNDTASSTGIGIYYADADVNISGNKVTGANTCLNTNGVSNLAVTGNTFTNCVERGHLFGDSDFDGPDPNPPYVAPVSALITGNTFENGSAGVENVAQTFELDACNNTYINITEKRFENPGPFAACGALQVLKYEDLNGNGEQDGGEAGLADWTIKVYQNDELVTSGDTAGDGYTEFELSEGEYKVCEVLETGWENTAPADAVNGCVMVEVTADGGGGGEIPGEDPVIVTTGNGDSFNIEFLGTSNDGKTWSYKVSETGDKSLSHWVLGVCETPIAHSGPGTYTDEHVAPGSSDPTTGVNGVKWDFLDNFDNEGGTEDDMGIFSVTFDQAYGATDIAVAVKSGGPASGQTGEGAITGPNCEPRETEPNVVKFGNYRLGEIIVNKHANPDAYWLDRPFDFSSDIPGWIFFDLNSNDSYSFPVKMGTFNITEISSPGNWDLTGLSCEGGTHEIDDSTATVTIDTSGQVIECTFVNERRPQIKILKYEDLNGNGTRDEGEPPLKGWQMFLFIDDGNDGWEQIQPREVRTDGNGIANYTGLEPGKNHLVCEEAREDWGNNQANVSPYGQMLCQKVEDLQYGEVRSVEFGNYEDITPVLALNLTSMCSDDPDVTRRWRVRNPNDFAVEVRWEVYGTAQTGTYLAPPGDSFFETETVGGPNTTKIYWLDENGNDQSKTKASSGQACEPQPDLTLNLTAECVVGDVLYWRVTNDNDVDVPFSWNGPGSNDGNGTALANQRTYFTTQDAGGANTTIINWTNPGGSTNSKTKAHNNQQCVYHVTFEKEWDGKGAPELLNTVILEATSSLGTAECGYDNLAQWVCVYSNGNDLPVPFGETYEVSESGVDGWQAVEGVGSGYTGINGFDQSALPNALVYDVNDNRYCESDPNAEFPYNLEKFCTHTVVNEPDDPEPEPGSLKVIKQVNLGVLAQLQPYLNLPGEWEFKIDDGQPFTINTNNAQLMGMTDPMEVAAGSYTIAEINRPAGFNTSVACSDQSDGDTSVNIEVSENEDAECTFTNSLQYGTLTLIKVVDGPDAPEKWSFKGSGPFGLEVSDFIPLLAKGGETVGPYPVPAGNYTIIEEEQESYEATAVCTSDKGQEVQGDASVEFALAEGENVTCIFTNSHQPKVGSITVEKDAGGNTETLFNFTLNGDSFQLSGGQSASFEELPAGEYTIAEVDLPKKWTLLGIGCTNGVNVEAPDSGEVTIDLKAGEDVRCKFTNNRPNAAVLDGVKAEAEAGQVRVSWRTLSEGSTVGYNVMRSHSPDSGFEAINDKLILAAGNSFEGAEYSIVDANVTAGETYYYYIQEVEADGVVEHTEAGQVVTATP